MSELLVTNIYNQEGEGAPSFPKGATSTGVITATSFSGSGANLTGIDATALKDTDGNVKIQANSTGAVVTGILTATGSVSVGGTLTYEDVTNVDSVGVITARSGIVATGVVTATSFSGSGANLTGIEAAPKITLNAAENINAGSAVVVNSSGQFTGITSSTAAKTPNGDGSGLFTSQSETGDGNYSVASNSANNKYRNIVFDPDNGITLITFQGNNGSHYGQAFTLSSDGVTWTAGSVKTIVSSSTSFTSLCYAGQGRFVSTYRDPNGWLRFKILTVNTSTLAITDGTETSVSGSNITIQSDSSERYQTRCIWHSPTNKIIFVYCQSGETFYRANYGTMNYGSNTIDTWASTNYPIWGTTETFIINDSPALAYDPDTQKIIFYAFYNGSTASVSAIAMTINANDITMGARYEVQQGSGMASNNMSVGYDTGTNHAVFSWKNNSNNWMMRIASVASNGTMTTVNADTIITGQSSGHCQYATMTCVGGGLIAFIWSDNAAGNMKMKVGTIQSNNTLHIGSAPEAEVLGSGTFEPRNAAYNSANKRVMVFYYYSGGALSNLQSAAVSTVDSNSNSYVGIANTTVTSGQSLVVRTFGGTTSTFTGLSTGSTYYVQSNGTFSTTADAEVSANPSVVGGIALNGTTMLVKS